MKPNRLNPLAIRQIGTHLATAIVLSIHVGAAEIPYRIAADSTAEITTATNWYGGVAPGVADVAAWKTDGDPGTAGNQESRGGALTVGSPVSWLGLRHEDSAGAISLSGSPITLGASGITEVRYENLTISNNIVLGTNQVWNNQTALTLNGNVTGAFTLTKELQNGDLITTGSTLGGGLVHMKTGRLVINPATVGSTLTIQSLRTQRDVRIGNDALVNIATGSLGLSTAGGFWIQPSGTGNVGRVTSSSGTLNVSSVDTNGVVTAGALTMVDHQFQAFIADFNGSTPLSVIKGGVNRLVTTRANTYTGTTAINGGILQANNAGGFGTGAVTVAADAQAYLNASGGVYANAFNPSGNGPDDAGVRNGAIRFNNSTISGNVTIGAIGARLGSNGGNSGTISGALGGGNVPLEIFNANIAITGNATAYTGAATVTQGSLTIGAGSTFGGSVTKAAGTTLTNNGTIAQSHTHTTGVLQGTGTFSGGLTLNGSTAADVLSIVSGPLHVGGNVNLTGNTVVRASGLGGNITVLTYSGTLAGGAANLTLEDAASFRGLSTFDTTTNGVIKLNIQGAAITWAGTANTNWDTTTLNWKNAGVDDKYFQSDDVTFGNVGAGTVNVVGSITPGSITFTNTLGSDYTFAGGVGNVIAGTTGITKTGDGNLTLNSSNTFTGAVSLSGGTTTIFARQVYTGGTTINNDAVLNLTGGGGQTGSIRGHVAINGFGKMMLSDNDVTGWGTGADRVSSIAINGGTLEANNATGNLTLSNLAITLTGGYITRGPAAGNGNMDLFNGSSSITTLTSPNTSVIDYGVNLGLRQPDTVFTVASGATSGVDLQINASVNNSIYAFANPNLIKNGPGTLLLNNPPTTIGGAAVYTGTTTINAGTLKIGDGGGTGIIGTGAITNNGTLIFDRFDEVNVPNTITGTGSLEQRGTGDLQLTSGGSRSGATIVSGGRLFVGTTPFTASAFQVGASGTISAGTLATGGIGSVSALALNGGKAAFRVSSASSDRLIVTANNGFTASAPSQIMLTPSGGLQTGDVIPLIDYSGSFANFGNLSVAASTNPHLSYSLVNNLVDTRVDLSVTLADPIIWKGNISNVWNENDISNWTTASNGLTSKFYTFDHVKFTNAGSANTTVELATDLIPSVVEFDASIDYTLTGGGITGAANLVKKNTGTATLSNFNTYTGTTTISGGTLQVDDLGYLPLTPIINNAALAFNIANPRAINHTISGTGQLVKRGTGDLTVTGPSSFTGPVIVEAGILSMTPGNTEATIFGTTAAGIVVNSGATFTTNGNTVPLGESLTIAGTGVAGYSYTGGGLLQGNLILTADATIGDDVNRMDIGTSTGQVPITGAFTLTKAGANSLWFRGPENGAGNSLATLVINAGTFGMEASNNTLNNVPITVNTGGILSAWALMDRVTPSTQNNPITLNGGTLAGDIDGQIWSGPISLTANSILGLPGAAGNGANTGFTSTGIISQTAGSFGLTKQGSSNITLAGVNTYTGNTVVNEGTLTLAQTGGLKFVIGASNINNKVTGAGTAAINGSFTLDLTGAAIANGNSWLLVDTTTKTFGATFGIAGFTEAADVHTMTTGNQTWTFTESSGRLELSVGATSGFDSWVANYPALPVNQRAPGDDFDADGFSNLLEYTLGGSPLVSSSSIAPTGVRSGSNFVVTFKRSDLSETDTTQILQYGSTLAGWTDIAIGASPGAGMVVISENTPTTDVDTVTVTIPTAAATKFFTRLKVSKP
ncbi:MAG: autotransporter-associated beta strand repeat-containing protein [Verrucomicrobiota bacterium]